MTETRAQWPLAVHLAYETLAAVRSPDSPGADDPNEHLAHRLYSQLSSGDRGARVPVRLWRSQLQNGVRQLPAHIPLDWAAKNVVIVVVDQNLFERRQDWNRCITALTSEARPGHDLILPVSIQADAARIAPSFADVNHIVVEEPGRLDHDERLFQAVYTSILRLLVPTLPRVFICHAKADGVRIAKRVRRYLYEESQLSCFFDMHDIPHGDRVRSSIEGSIRDSVVLAIWTDRLLDSPWCQLEIIEARRQQRPMLVLDALVTKTPRLFPFLGNMPVLRWRSDPSVVVSAILLELIRAYHLEAIFQSRQGPAAELPPFCLHPPDLLDSRLDEVRAGSAELRPLEPARSSPEVWVYPDPPLKPGESGILRTLVPTKRFLSLIEWQALRAANALGAEWNVERDLRPEPLRGMQVGVSVSPSDAWADIGLMAPHQDDLSFQIALQLILLGAKVVWGGDLRPDGFGSQLKWIVEAYQHPARAPQDHVAMAVPFTLRMDAAALRARRAFAEVRVAEYPAILKPTPLASGTASAEGPALTAFALSTMRSALGKQCHARLLLGGGLARFQGLYPGVAEEAFETVRNGGSIYVLGGFGGAASAVYDAIEGADTAGAAQLLRASHTVGAAAIEDNRRAHARLVESTGATELAFAPELVTTTFSGLGTDGLSKRNGLSIAENGRLAQSQDVHEILEYVVKGLLAARGPADS